MQMQLAKSMTFLPGARGCVISGGGAHGAFPVGVMQVTRPDYDVVAGISTGALQAPLIALGQFDRLSEAYSNVTLESIFSKSPFTPKGGVRWLYAGYKLLTKQHSVGEMHNLKKLIAQFYTRADHDQLSTSGKIVIIGAVNMSQEPHRLELFSPHTHSYETFCAAMYASSCFYPVGEMAEINSCYYADGGFLESIIIDEAIEAGVLDIDVFVLRPKSVYKKLKRPKHMLEGGLRLLKAIRYDTVYENLEKACKKASTDDHTPGGGRTIRVYNLPYKLSDNAMYFNKKEMQSWIALGSACAHNPEICQIY